MKGFKFCQQFLAARRLRDGAIRRCLRGAVWRLSFLTSRLMRHQTGYAVSVMCALPCGDGVEAANVEQGSRLSACRLDSACDLIFWRTSSLNFRSWVCRRFR